MHYLCKLLSITTVSGNVSLVLKENLSTAGMTMAALTSVATRVQLTFVYHQHQFVELLTQNTYLASSFGFKESYGLFNCVFLI